MSKAVAQLLPYQIRWIDDEADCIGEKSRRTGWTWAEAYDAVRRRFNPTQPRPFNYWFSSADESAGFEYIDYCRFFAQDLFRKVADKISVEEVEAPETRKGYINSFVLRCPNGTRITAMSSNPRRFRSKGGDVRVDEAAFHDDAEGMHDAAAPCTQWGGNYKTWSTHNGEGALFYKFVETCRKVYAALGHNPDQPPPVPYNVLAAKALELGVSPVFSYHRVTIADAIDQGLVEKINASTGAHGSREEFLNKIKLKTRNLDALKQEYYCIASADATAWLTYKLIESCESEDVPQPIRVDLSNRYVSPIIGYGGAPVYVGIDVGRFHDLTVVVVAELVGDVLWPIQIIYIYGVPIPDQVDVITRALKGLRLVRVCVDYTGVGIGLGDGLVKTLGQYYVENIPQTNPAKEIEAVALLTSMQDKRMRLPANNQPLRDALHKIRKEYTGITLQPRFVAERTDEGHADQFWGFALLAHAAQRRADEVGHFQGRTAPRATFARSRAGRVFS